jgi:hypothetical protein
MDFFKLLEALTLLSRLQESHVVTSIEDISDEVKQGIEKAITEELKSFDKECLYRLEGLEGLNYIRHESGTVVSECQELLEHQFMFSKQDLFFYMCGHCERPHSTSIIMYDIDNKQYYRGRVRDFVKIEV